MRLRERHPDDADGVVRAGRQNRLLAVVGDGLENLGLVMPGRVLGDVGDPEVALRRRVVARPERDGRVEHDRAVLGDGVEVTVAARDLDARHAVRRARCPGDVGHADPVARAQAVQHEARIHPRQQGRRDVVLLAERLAERLEALRVELGLLVDVGRQRLERPADVGRGQGRLAHESGRVAGSALERPQRRLVDEAGLGQARRLLKPHDGEFGVVAPAAVDLAARESGPVEQRLHLDDARPGDVAAEREVERRGPVRRRVDAGERLGVEPRRGRERDRVDDDAAAAAGVACRLDLGVGREAPVAVDRHAALRGRVRRGVGRDWRGRAVAFETTRAESEDEGEERKRRTSHVEEGGGLLERHTRWEVPKEGAGSRRRSPARPHHPIRPSSAVGP